MRASRSQLAGIIDKLLEKRSPSKVAKEVAAYLLSAARTHELDPMIRDIMALRAQRGLVEATVVSAHKLEDKSLNEIRRLVKKIKPETKSLVIDERLNPALIGGVKLNVINDQLDLSIRAKLSNFKESINKRGAN